ncbi:MAG: alpha/beta hydrolase, partial [Pseudomonadota bacterium]
MDWDIDWDDAFDNMGSVEGSHLFVDRWGNLSSQFRERWAQTGSVELDVSYGSHPRQKFDLFRPEGPSRGTIIFVHGGYWIRTSKETWSFLAEGALANGWNVVLPGYPLAPEVKVADITRSIIDAVTVIMSKL